MASKTPNEFQQKINAVKKLMDLGIRTEKDIAGLDFENLIYSENVSISELRAFSALKDSVKNHRLFSFLTGSLDEMKE